MFTNPLKSVCPASSASWCETSATSCQLDTPWALVSSGLLILVGVAPGQFPHDAQIGPGQSGRMRSPPIDGGSSQLPRQSAVPLSPLDRIYAAYWIREAGSIRPSPFPVLPRKDLRQQSTARGRSWLRAGDGDARGKLSPVESLRLETGERLGLLPTTPAAQRLRSDPASACADAAAPDRLRIPGTLTSRQGVLRSEAPPVRALCGCDAPRPALKSPEGRPRRRAPWRAHRAQACR